MRSLVSRIILEMITFRIGNLKELNDKIDQLGFGEKGEIVESYSEPFFLTQTKIHLTQELS